MNLRYILLVILLTFGSFSNAAPKLKIAFVLDDLSIARWQRDRDYFVAKARDLGAKVYVQSASGDAEMQIDKIRKMIQRRVNVLVIIATDGRKLKEVIDDAKAAGIKVLAYDRLINDANIDAYISFDNIKVGELQAQAVLKAKPKGNYFLLGGAPSDNNAHMFREGQMNILQPAIDNGAIKIIEDKWARAWSGQKAFEFVQHSLKNNTRIDAIVASNDALAEGAIKALSRFNLVGKIPISGQDSNLSAIRRIVKQQQTMTIYKPVKTLARTSADIAITLARGEPIDAKAVLDNGFKKVPSILLDPILVTRNNIDKTVIADGFLSRVEVYK